MSDPADAPRQLGHKLGILAKDDELAGPFAVVNKKNTELVLKNCFPGKIRK